MAAETLLRTDITGSRGRHSRCARFCKTAYDKLVGNHLQAVYVRKLTESPSLVELRLLAGYLEQEGIETTVLNEHQGGTPGVPHWALSVWAELWVSRENQYEKAKALFARYRRERTQPPGPEWQCPACSEANPASFESCWQCAALPAPDALSDRESGTE